MPIRMDKPSKMLLLKGEPKTFQIESINLIPAKGWSVRFKNSSKTFVYGFKKVEWLSSPTTLQPETYRLYHDGKLLKDVTDVWLFNNHSASFWRIKFKSGKETEYGNTHLTVVRNCLTEKASQDVFAYLHDVAEINELGKDGDEPGLLENLYSQHKFVEDSTAAACYLAPSKYKPKKLHTGFIIYPFGCNASQKVAIDRAFDSQISIIQGPPGTGKTQTILNIVSNIVRHNKTVLIASNNNSAIANIQEKLAKYGLDFIVAPLGKRENKDLFISRQPELPADLPSRALSTSSALALKNKITRTLEKLTSVYTLQNRLARLRHELQTVELEWKHFCMDNNINSDNTNTRRVNSSKVIKLWLNIQSDAESNVPLSIPKKLELWWLKQMCKHRWGVQTRFDKGNIKPLIVELQTLYYLNRIRELNNDISSSERRLQSLGSADTLSKCLTENSLRLFKAKLSGRYKPGRTVFADWKDIRKRSSEFLAQYPVVLSTTFSACTSLIEDKPFDYLIMDEASQVSVETGTLAMMCARNAVIVGDSMQLPNVITDEDKAKLNILKSKYNISPGYDCAENSFLQSVCRVIKDAPQTLLREHYRCHPRIINFCNQMFYGGNLLIMTEDNGERDVVSAVKTAKGNHSADRYNQREIDVVRNEVLPQLSRHDDIGIITPYNRQAYEFNRQLPTIEAATIHKYQGREKDTIILSTVDNQISAFADDPNMLNVAVSRAKTKFCLVMNGNEQSRNGNIQSLLDYISYNNGTITDSKIASIFDYLYEQYTEQRIALTKRKPHVSEYDSENLTYALLSDILANDIRFAHLHIVCHIPMRSLIRDTALMNEDELRYASNYNTHIDFLLVNRVSHKPVLAIETDGYSYHNESTEQHRRDLLKNSILDKYNIPLLRLSTKGSDERQRITSELVKLSCGVGSRC